MIPSSGLELLKLVLGIFELLEVTLIHSCKLFFTAGDRLLQVINPFKLTLELCLTLNEACLESVVLLLRHHLRGGLRCVFCPTDVECATLFAHSWGGNIKIILVQGVD